MIIRRASPVIGFDDVAALDDTQQISSVIVIMLSTTGSPGEYLVWQDVIIADPYTYFGAERSKVLRHNAFHGTLMLRPVRGFQVMTAAMPNMTTKRPRTS